MKDSRLHGVASASLIAITFICTGCSTARPSSGFPLTTVFANVAAVTSDWRHQESDQRYLNAVAVLEREESFVETVRIAREAEAARRDADPRSAPLYAKVAIDCWATLPAVDDGEELSEVSSATWDLYHHSVAQFVRSANVHGQLNPKERVSFVSESGEPRFIAINHRGFPWEKDDFSELRLPDKRDHDALERYWAEQGLGVPVIALRRGETSEGFMNREVAFSATCILRPLTQEEASQDNDRPDRSDAESAMAAVLELHDPLRVKQIAYDRRQWDLAGDVSAPLAMATRTVDQDKLLSFFNPASAKVESGIRMIEPYQPGKIPLIFVHGLLSDRFTWVDLVNDLRSVEGLTDHYQIWSFQYPTGQPFIRSAAEMRRELGDIVGYLDPDGSDAALTQMVLIGHSMGGLVSKLQITRSESVIWDSVATRRVEELNASPEIRGEIEQLFFFDPSPFVKRVIFIGSPHQGSQMATKFVGKLGAALVMTPNDRESRFKEIVRANPDIFIGKLANRLPSSVDLLRPDNPMLLASYKLAVNPDVRMHTIIGTGRELSDETPGDGVVAVESARHPGTISELLIDATHTQLTSHPETTTELVRILGDHLQQNDVPDVSVAGMLP